MHVSCMYVLLNWSFYVDVCFFRIIIFVLWVKSSDQLQKSLSYIRPHFYTEFGTIKINGVLGKSWWVFSVDHRSFNSSVCVCICSIQAVVLICTEFSSSDITHRYYFWWIIWTDTEKTILSYQCEMFIMVDKSLSHWAQSSKMIPSGD